MGALRESRLEVGAHADPEVAYGNRRLLQAVGRPPSIETRQHLRPPRTQRSANAMNTVEPESLAALLPATLAHDLPLVDTQAAPAPKAPEQTPEEFEAWKEARSREMIRATRLADFKASCPEQFKKKIDRSLI